MGTEIAISFSNLRAQLESERSSLFKIDENIKKIVQSSGRFTDRFNATGDYTRGGARPGGRNPYPDITNNYNKTEDQLKRKHETKTVFSRLSARVPDSDGEEDGPKRTRMSSAVSRELPTRAAVLRAQGDDEQARTRNRRIFGSLLGTLQKFKQEEIVLQTKEEKKAQVERKIEEQARLEKEREQKERKTLFAEREHKKATIKALEAKMGRVQEFEKWEASQQCLSNFILTKAKPQLYWIPKKMSEKAEEKLVAARKVHEKYISKKREELQEELVRIEQRCRRPRAAPRDPPPRARPADAGGQADGADGGDGDGARRRDKFAMEADDKGGDDSDGDGDGDGDDDRTRDRSKVSECDDIKMDTSTEHIIDDKTIVSETADTDDTAQPIVEANGDHS